MAPRSVGGAIYLLYFFIHPLLFFVDIAFVGVSSGVSTSSTNYYYRTYHRG